MPSIQRLSVLKPAASDFGTAPTDGHLLYAALNFDYVASVIATNTQGTTGGIYIYVVPGGATITTNSDNYGLIAYNLSISGYNTYETFRFAVNQGDEVWVAGSAGIAYYLQGIEQG
jgi:hypothetical protein